MSNDQQTPQPPNRNQLGKLLAAVQSNSQPLAAFAAIFLLATAAGIACAVYASSKNSPIVTVTANIAASLAGSAFWFTIAFLYSKQYLQAVHEYNSLQDFPLERYVKTSSRIEVNVHGWDGLLLGRGCKGKNPLDTERGKVWEEFFKRRGTLVLILPDISTHVGGDLHVIAMRNGMSDDEQRDEIKATEALARQIAGSTGVVEVRRAQSLRWICTIKFDDDQLLISPYTKKAKGAEFVGPAFLINLAVYESTRKWVEDLHSRELTHSGNIIHE